MGGPEGGPLGGPVGPSAVSSDVPDSGWATSGSDSAVGSVDVSTSSVGASRDSMSPNAPPNMLSSWDCSSSSRAFSAEVFPLAMVAPISPTWRGLNSGCVPGGMQLPAWCRGYHAGLSFLRPGFNSRSGRHLIPLPREQAPCFVALAYRREEGTTSQEAPGACQDSSPTECRRLIQTQ